MSQIGIAPEENGQQINVSTKYERATFLLMSEQLTRNKYFISNGFIYYNKYYIL